MRLDLSNLSIQDKNKYTKIDYAFNGLIELVTDWLLFLRTKLKRKGQQAVNSKYIMLCTCIKKYRKDLLTKKAQRIFNLTFVPVTNYTFS